MCFGKNETTSQQSIPKWLEKGGKFTFNEAKNFFNDDYDKYGKKRVAPFSPAQNNAFSAIQDWAKDPSAIPGEAIDLTRDAATAGPYSLAPTGGGYSMRQTGGSYSMAPTGGAYKYGSGGAGGAYQLGSGGAGGAFELGDGGTGGAYQYGQGGSGGAYQMGSGGAGGATQLEDYGRVVDEGGKLGKMSDYINPYVSKALNPAIREIERAATAERMRLGDRAASAGAYGDARHGVMEGVSDRNRTEAIGDTAYRAYSDAYNNAMNARQADLGRFASRDVNQGQFNEAAESRGLTREQMGQRAFEEAQARGLTREQSMAAAYEAAQGRGLAREQTELSAYEQAQGRGLSREQMAMNAYQEAQARGLTREQAMAAAYEAGQGRALTRDIQQGQFYEAGQGRALTRDTQQGQFYEAGQNRNLTRDTAQGNFYEQGLDRQTGGAAQMQALDTAGMQNRFQQLMAGMGVGNQQQQQQQNKLDTKYEAWQTQMQDEYDRLAALVGAVGGVPYTRTTTTTQPNNSWAQLAGSAVGAILPG